MTFVCQNLFKVQEFPFSRIDKPELDLQEMLGSLLDDSGKWARRRVALAAQCECG